MEVKGVAFIAREQFVKAVFGARIWDDLMTEVCAKHPSFKDLIFPSTLINVREFLDFNDMLVEKLYEGDDTTYWKFGEKSAEWALTEGPYHKFLDNKQPGQFIMTLPLIWSIYFTAGKAQVTIVNENEFEILVVQVSIPHVYFEYLTLGYAKRGLELAGAKTVNMTAVRGFSKGDKDILYRIKITI